ncbi:hypothetical protein KKB44_01545 [Candidatus Micrarchaeota archaeon]|nr:hypothetical protein [Candidatus Micrarchaeota archaeon]
MKISKKQKKSIDVTTSYFDINQLELAFINRALESSRRLETPHFIEIGRSRRILRIQKRNLLSMCKGSNKETRKDRLESELRKVLCGERRLSISCFLFR